MEEGKSEKQRDTHTEQEGMRDRESKREGEKEKRKRRAIGPRSSGSHFFSGQSRQPKPTGGLLLNTASCYTTFHRANIQRAPDGAKSAFTAPSICLCLKGNIADRTT